MKKKNGWTLIELLGVIVVLEIIILIVIPTISGTTESAQKRSEEIFIDRLSTAIDSYISLYNGELIFIKQEDGTYKSKNQIDLVTLKNKNIIDSIMNPVTKKECSGTFDALYNADYVYCFVLNISKNCLIDTKEDKIVNTCPDNFK